MQFLFSVVFATGSSLPASMPEPSGCAPSHIQPASQHVEDDMRRSYFQPLETLQSTVHVLHPNQRDIGIPWVRVKRPQVHVALWPCGALRWVVQCLLLGRFGLLCGQTFELLPWDEVTSNLSLTEVKTAKSGTALKQFLMANFVKQIEVMDDMDGPGKTCRKSWKLSVSRCPVPSSLTALSGSTRCPRISRLLPTQLPQTIKAPVGHRYQDGFWLLQFLMFIYLIFHKSVHVISYVTCSWLFGFDLAMFDLSWRSQCKSDLAKLRGSCHLNPTMCTRHDTKPWHHDQCQVDI